MPIMSSLLLSLPPELLQKITLAISSIDVYGTRDSAHLNAWSLSCKTLRHTSKSYMFNNLWIRDASSAVQYCDLVEESLDLPHYVRHLEINDPPSLSQEHIAPYATLAGKLENLRELTVVARQEHCRSFLLHRSIAAPKFAVFQSLGGLVTHLRFKYFHTDVYGLTEVVAQFPSVVTLSLVNMDFESSSKVKQSGPSLPCGVVLPQPRLATLELPWCKIGCDTLASLGDCLNLSATQTLLLSGYDGPMLAVCLDMMPELLHLSVKDPAESSIDPYPVLPLHKLKSLTVAMHRAMSVNGRCQDSDWWTSQLARQRPGSALETIDILPFKSYDEPFETLPSRDFWRALDAAASIMKNLRRINVCVILFFEQDGCEELGQEEMERKAAVILDDIRSACPEMSARGVLQLSWDFGMQRKYIPDIQFCTIM